MPFFVANLQPQPPLPPENIVTEQERQTLINYEQWLTTQESVLNDQMNYYQLEVQKLRKTRKSLNSKQRALKKTNSELNQTDSLELAKVTADQTCIQKQLENSRKQLRQHSLIVQVSILSKKTLRIL